MKFKTITHTPEDEPLMPCGDCDPCLGGRPDQCALFPSAEIPMEEHHDTNMTEGHGDNHQDALELENERLTKRCEELRRVAETILRQYDAARDERKRMANEFHKTLEVMRKALGAITFLAVQFTDETHNTVKQARAALKLAKEGK